jgi:hypothetical protein
MACSHDTQTRPEFTYLFLGTPSDKPDATPSFCALKLTLSSKPVHIS